MTIGKNSFMMNGKDGLMKIGKDGLMTISLDTTYDDIEENGLMMISAEIHDDWWKPCYDDR